MRNRLKIDQVEFAANFERRPFYIEHDLAGHPLLELSAIAALSQRLRPPQVEWNTGHASVYGKPDATGPAALPCAEAILGVAERPTWVLLLRVQTDPVYRRLLDELLDEIEPLAARIRRGMHRREGFIFVSSRESVTPFHFDPEYNFLLQARGAKTVHMWNAADRSVMPAAAIDNFYARFRSNRDLPYEESFEDRAWVLPLCAGQGLHFPLHAPHWVKTESEVSVSLSITFRSRQSRFREYVHLANAHVRRVGIEPPFPGTSVLWDGFSHFGYRAARKSLNLFNRARQRVSQAFPPSRS